ncbi:MAG: BspA family leucine-rich repeat surface protein [Lachnospiraceae bacterium]|nr:BspA family leucine-rich repeat surface protein [Lachnospiraceae bacterium]
MGNGSVVEDFSVENGVILESGKNLFINQTELKKVDLKGLDTSNTVDMRYMFSGCSSLETVDVKGLDISNVTNMSYMFSNCSNLTKINNLADLNTESVEHMEYMFSGCEKLSEADVSGFVTDSVVDFKKMFYNCKSLNSLDLHGFSLSGVRKYMTGTPLNFQYIEGSTDDMLKGCDGLKLLKAPNNFGNGKTIDLPFTMYLQKADGTADSTGYDELSALNAGKTLVITKDAALHTVTDKTVKFANEAIDVSILFTLANGSGSASYSLSNGGTGVGTLNGNMLTVTKAGTFKVSVSTAETDSMYSGKATATLTVNRGDGVGSVTVKDVNYGEKPDPKASSTTNPGEANFLYKLKDADDSTYSAEIPVNPGTYVVKAVFAPTDLYECNPTAEFTIAGSFDISKADVKLSETEYKYDGYAKEPKVTVKIGEKALKEGSEYTVEYSDNVNAGTASVKVSGKGGFTGSVTLKFTIKADNNGNGGNGNNSSENGNGGENTEETKTNPYEEYGLSDKYVPNGYEDKSGSPMIIEGKADCTWNFANNKAYWYEGGIKQGTYYDPHGVLGEDPDTHEATIRGREIYDAESDGWYWLDSCYDGAKAVGKEVWVPYIYQDEKDWDEDKMREIAYESDEGMGELVFNFMKEKKGKWVRYDENGRMLKGWVTIEGALADIYPDQAGNTYYYDNRTGLMAKGWVKLDGKDYFFDETTGALVP